MSDHAQRGVFLLVAAFVALLVLIANGANEGPEALTQVATAVLVIGGGLGAVLLALGLLRD